MKYTATAVVSFGAGADLGLTKPQVDARVASLRPIGGRKGWYTTTAPVQFKAGEEIQYDGDLPKAVALEAASSVAARRRAAEEKALDDERRAAAQAASDLAAKRAALLEQVDILTAAMGKAQAAAEKATLQQQLDVAQAALAELG